MFQDCAEMASPLGRQMAGRTERDGKHQAWVPENGTILRPKGKGKGIIVFLLPWSRLDLRSLPGTRQQELLDLGNPSRLQSCLNTGGMKAIGMAKCYSNRLSARLFQSQKQFTRDRGFYHAGRARRRGPCVNSGQCAETIGRASIM